jgi:hypothetical protein
MRSSLRFPNAKSMTASVSAEHFPNPHPGHSPGRKAAFTNEVIFHTSHNMYKTADAYMDRVFSYRNRWQQGPKKAYNAMWRTNQGGRNA